MSHVFKILAQLAILTFAVYFCVPAVATEDQTGADSARSTENGLLPPYPSACPAAKEHNIPLPTSVSPDKFVAYEFSILKFLQNADYKTLKWCEDKGVRDTGPYQNRKYYGTHPAVRIFYSPKMMAWLDGGRIGNIPDGAMIIKEQYPPPAGRYAHLPDCQLPVVTDWTIMIKDAKGAKDGWFWGELA